MLVDSAELREILVGHYDGLSISDVALKSGQRVVYFGDFKNFERIEAEETASYEWSKWGKVAIKISDGSSANEVARMQSEISALSGIDSNFYPKLYYFELLSFNAISEQPLKPKLFVTIEEYISSVPLSSCMDQYDSELKVVGLLVELIKALNVLWQHPQRYVHRDIKPANILIRQDGSIVIIDLGIIRESGSIGLTNTHQLIGPCSPGYASPEQIMNDKKNITFKSDLFALGVLCYQIISGSMPFVAEGDGLQDVIEKTCNYHPEPLKNLRMCSNELSDVIEKLMQKQPFRRYRDISSLISKLEMHKENLNDR